MTGAQWVTLIAAILAFVASGIATAVAAYNGRFRRFAQQRWWERKADAYTRIIEALADLVYHHETHLLAAEEHITLSESRKTQIAEYWRRGHAEVRRSTAMGAFLISPDAETALRRMWEEDGKGVEPNDWYGSIESSYVAAQNCLKQVVAAAQIDLHR